MEEVKIHSGTRVKLKHIDEEALSPEFLERLRNFAHADERIQAIYVFAIESEGRAEQPSMAIALKAGKIFARKDDGFLQIVDEVQMLLPDELAFNLYRFGASDFLAAYLIENVEPVYLRATAWLDKQHKRYVKG